MIPFKAIIPFSNDRPTAMATSTTPPIARASQNTAPQPSSSSQTSRTTELGILIKEIKMLKRNYGQRILKLEEKVESNANKITTKLTELELNINRISQSGNNFHTASTPTNSTDNATNNINAESIKRETLEKMDSKTELLIKMIDLNSDKFNAKISELERQLQQLELKLSRTQDEGKIRSSLNAIANKITVINETKMQTTLNECTKLNDQVNEAVVKYTALLSKLHNNNTGTSSSIAPLHTLEQKLCNEINQIKADLTTSSLDQLLSYHCEAAVWILTDVNNPSRITFESESQEFKILGYQLRGKIKLYVKENNAIVANICFIDHEKSGKPLSLKVLPKITYVVMDTSGAKDAKHLIRSCNLPFSKTLVSDIYCREQFIATKSQLLNPPYNNDNTVMLKILIEPPSIAEKVFSTDGVLIWRIENYTKKRQSAVDLLEVLHDAPYFYTNPTGHRVVVSACLEGLSDLNGLTTVLNFVTGKFDSQPQKSCTYRITVILFNQLNSTHRITKHVTIDLKKSLNALVDLAPHSVIETEGFLSNDSLLLKVVIE